MASRSAVSLPLEHPERDSAGQLHLRIPPRSDSEAVPPPLLDYRDTGGDEEGLAPVQLLENEEYLYEIELNSSSTDPVTVEPRNFFDPDEESGLRGRLRPGLHTGLLTARVRAGHSELGTVTLEVRSRKLDYRRHYRWMLRDLADGMAEIVMQRFAPTEQRFELDMKADAATLYQRFAFLRSLLESDVFDGAIQQVLRRPYRTWVAEEERRRPGQGIPATSTVARQLTGPGPRAPAGALEAMLGMPTVPRRLTVTRTEETRDNVPNRFVRFAFERWRDVVAQIEDLLRAMPDTGPVERGLRECQALRDRLDTVLAQELFRACGRLEAFPASNQVLQKREGYRDVFRAYIQFEAAAQLIWSGGEDVYGAGQRDVATLYEYWVFHALGREISQLCDVPFDFSRLIEPTAGRLNLRLKKGEQQILSGTVRRLGRELALELWFNRTFSAAKTPQESWTRAMRPDYSVRIRGDQQEPGFFHREVWLHFDAKYRLDRLEEALGGQAAVEDPDPKAEEQELEAEEQAETEGRVVRSDLLKMHAYRDAIRRSSGAYVVYPGTEHATHREYHEILPGLGAFALRPTRAGRAEGASQVRTFIDRVLDQVALQTSQHERARYWTRESYTPEDGDPPHVRAASFLERPPADTPVLLGYVRSAAQRRWIVTEGLYNLRADGRTGSVALDSDELGAEYVLLYGRGADLPEVREIAGEPRLLDRDDMLARGYPNAGGELYFCLPLGIKRNHPPIDGVASRRIVELHARLGGGRRGSPLVLSWQELAEGMR